MAETWKAVVGWEGQYEVSDQGRVRSLGRKVVNSNGVRRRLRGRVLRPASHATGYPVVGLWRNNQGVTRTVHSLVAEAFLGPRPEGMEVCHGDQGPGVAAVSNLRYDTHRENLLDTIRAGTNSKVTSICSRGHRKEGPNRLSYGPPGSNRSQCRACRRERSLSWKYNRTFSPDKADENYRKIMGE